MRIIKVLTGTAIAAMIMGCNPVKLPDPTVRYPTPPAALMEPSQNMQEIK